MYSWENAKRTFACAAADCTGVQDAVASLVVPAVPGWETVAASKKKILSVMHTVEMIMLERSSELKLEVHWKV